jgi:hypothetical protein
MTDFDRRDFLTQGAVAAAGVAVVAAAGSALAKDAPAPAKPLRRYVIEREVPGIGLSSDAQWCEMAQASDAALAQLAPRIQWEHSYAADNKTFCVYLAVDEAAIMEHSRISGFPAHKITLIDRIVDPTTAIPPAA